VNSLNIKFVIKPAQDLTENEIKDMVNIMAQNSYKTQMAQAFHAGITANVKQLCAYVQNHDEIIGACVVKEYQSANGHPVSDEFPNIYFKHMAIKSTYQNQDIGTKLFDEILQRAFIYFNTNIIWSETSTIGALKFYHQLGAWFSIPSIETVNFKISPDENTKCVRAMIKDSQLKKWRLPNEIIFAWPKPETNAEDYLLQHNFKKDIWKTNE